MSRRQPSSFWVMEDTSSYHERGVARSSGAGLAPIAMRLYRVRRNIPELVAETNYLPRSEGRGREFKGTLALELLRRAKVRRGVVVAGARFAQGTSFLMGLAELNIAVVLALPSSIVAEQANESEKRSGKVLSERLAQAKWRATKITAPNSAAHYSIAELGRVAIGEIRGLRCLALSTGGITDFRRGLMVGVSTVDAEMPAEHVAYLLGWSRWIRFVSRRSDKKLAADSRPVSADERLHLAGSAEQRVKDLTARVNLKHARRQDQQSADLSDIGLFDSESVLRGRLAAGRRRINIVELFAGAGGMGLGFLMNASEDQGYRVLFSGEIDPVFANTLRVNHDFLRTEGAVAVDDVPEDTVAVDLRSPSVMDKVQSVSREFGGVDVVIGGPPCQGFSNANRNSWSSKNPNNKLVETYLDYVIRLRPRVFIMENVQGIMWTKKHGGHEELSVAEDVASRFASAGYRIFPKLLDAAWYGVPQHRNRFFLLGVHADLGYSQDGFGEWGPFPRPTHGPSTVKPYVSVREAISDLPRIENGASAEELAYAAHCVDGNAFLAAMRRWAPCDVMWDHVTSKHADYVLERYEKIPAGGNWSDIAHMMTNYAAVERTHSNIYRRLNWDEPAITIGHYRKAMLIHPEQNRGLSLREASRLQSFPDWFRFAGSEHRIEGGLTYKQQQLGNAVSPLVTRAVASYLLKL
jgi:DNA-cytosine methyltransferase